MPEKLLYISHRIPFPPNKGDKIRTFNEVRYLSRRFKIDLVSFADNPEDLKYIKDLEIYCRHVFIYPLSPGKGKLKGLQRLMSGRTISEGYFFSAKACRKVRGLIRQNDYQSIFCFSSPMAEYIFKNISSIQQKKTKPKLIMDFCDVDSMKWRQYAKGAKFPLTQIYNTESRRLLAYEKKVNQVFDASVFVSEDEANLFKRLLPGAENVFPISNGVDSVFFSNTEPGTESNKKTLMFAGAMDYYANIEGVTWFCNEILPVVKKRIPDIKFLIVGNNPTANVKALESDYITVTGFVQDIRTYYKKANVCVTPLRIARGIQNKVLEAMAMSKPIVSTSAALSGIGARPGDHLLIADKKNVFIDSVCRLIENPETAFAMGQDARKFVEKEFSWNAKLKKLDRLF